MLWSFRVVCAATVCLHVSGFAAVAGEGRTILGNALIDGSRFRHHLHQAIKPISVNIVDPMMRVSRLPSGRILIEDPLYPRHGYGRSHRRFDSVARQRAPYAPPAFYIIGEPSKKNMGRPVSLNHGIKPPRGLKTQPNVVFLVQKPGQKRFSVKN